MSRGRRSGAVGSVEVDVEAGCSVLHVELDTFFVSVELARRPQLRGRPVVVAVPDGGVVLSASAEAQALGVRPAMTMVTARTLCPQAVVVPPDHAAYRDVAAGVLAVLRDVTAIVEQVGLDAAFLDVRGARRRLGPPSVIAAGIRDRVRGELGITCSVGIASTKVVARLASAQAMPDGVLLVPKAASAAFLRTLPVGALDAVGERVEAALARRGVRTVADLVHCPPAAVQRAVGTVAGAHLVDLAWGRDPRPVDPSAAERSVGAEVELAGESTDVSAVELTAHLLAERCTARLRRQGQVARTVSITVRTSDLRTLTRSRTLVTPTDAGREVNLVARALLAGVDLGGPPVRLVGMRLDGLSVASGLVRPPTADEAVSVLDARPRDVDLARRRPRDASGATAGRAGAMPVGRRAGSTTTIVPSDLS